jgi:hypothetical protein
MMLGVFAEFLIFVSQAVGRLTRKQHAAPEDMEISQLFRYDEPVMQFDASAMMERVKITGVSQCTGNCSCCCLRQGRTASQCWARE